jgi:hypothetical protein
MNNSQFVDYYTIEKSLVKSKQYFSTFLDKEHGNYLQFAELDK